MIFGNLFNFFDTVTDFIFGLIVDVIMVPAQAALILLDAILVIIFGI